MTVYVTVKGVIAHVTTETMSRGASKAINKKVTK